jgi:hypothetical protein
MQPGWAAFPSLSSLFRNGGDHGVHGCQTASQALSQCGTERQGMHAIACDLVNNTSVKPKPKDDKLTNVQTHNSRKKEPKNFSSSRANRCKIHTRKN